MKQMYNIKTLNKISPMGLSRLDRSRFQIGDDIENPDAVMVRSADMNEAQFGSNLRCIVRAGAGTNNIPVARCSEAGIVVFNTPGANANAVKELVICSMLLASRDIIGGIEWAKTIADQGDAVPKLIEKGKSKFVGPEIENKKVGVIGLGAIGVMVANACQNLGMEVYGYDPYISVDAAWGLSRAVIKSASTKEIFEKCDFISLHVPLNNETKGMINSAAFLGMKRGVRIINFARADLVESADMIEALDSGIVSKYVTDFPTAAMISHDGVIAIPHLGASTPESEDNCAVMAACQMADYLENGNIKNSVNLPDVSMPREGAMRLVVIHRNIPNVISGISSAFAAEGINIENMVNKSKKEFACTILDAADKFRDSVIDKVQAIEGVLRIRVIK